MEVKTAVAIVPLILTQAVDAGASSLKVHNSTVTVNAALNVSAQTQNSFVGIEGLSTSSGTSRQHVIASVELGADFHTDNNVFWNVNVEYQPVKQQIADPFTFLDDGSELNRIHQQNTWIAGIHAAYRDKSWVMMAGPVIGWTELKYKSVLAGIARFDKQTLGFGGDIEGRYYYNDRVYFSAKYKNMFYAPKSTVVQVDGGGGQIRIKPDIQLASIGVGARLNT